MKIHHVKNNNKKKQIREIIEVLKSQILKPKPEPHLDKEINVNGDKRNSSQDQQISQNKGYLFLDMDSLASIILETLIIASY